MVCCDVVRSHKRAKRHDADVVKVLQLVRVGKVIATECSNAIICYIPLSDHMGKQSDIEANCTKLVLDYRNNRLAL